MSRRLIVAHAAARRLDRAGAWLAEQRGEVVVLARHRGAADDFVRDRVGPGLGGVRRKTLFALAAELAAELMSAEHLAPLSGLGAEAVAARAVHAELKDGTLERFAPVARLPGFARSLARTLRELRAEEIAPSALAGAAGRDLARLGVRYELELERARVADEARLLRLAIDAVPRSRHHLVGRPILSLDLAFSTRLEARLLAALVARAPGFAATLPAGDAVAIARLETILGAAGEPADDEVETNLSRLRRTIFAPGALEPRAPDRSFDLFSAADEGREAVEMARRIGELAATGTRFDRIAILLRSPEAYQPLLEDALRRAGIDAYYSRGSARPNAAGRAFLALLQCAAERLSAGRFAEYLSLGQVPRLDEVGAPPRVETPWVASGGETQLVFRTDGRERDEDGPEPDPVLLRVPRRWQEMLVEASVVGGRDRWARRLAGLGHELERQAEALAELDEPRAERKRIDRLRLENLERFALPIIDTLAALPSAGTWGDWLGSLEPLATLSLERPEPVLAVLAELRPMAEVGPVALADVASVLEDRLRSLRDEPPKHRYGRVFVGLVDEAEARSFDVVFLPGLAEGMFPKKAYEDPLLLDEVRHAIDRRLPDLARRFADERALLLGAASAATRALNVSYPRTDMALGKPRVPSFYALDLVRAAEGRIPAVAAFEKRAAEAADSRLGWPAPRKPERAIDEAEHDLSTLLEVIEAADPGGRAAYLLDHPGVHRALRARMSRWKRSWGRADGLVDPEAVALLAPHRLRSRSYSPTALQRFATCPYQFHLQAVLRLRPREDLATFEEMDPLTRGSLFHEAQHRFVSALRAEGALPITNASLPRALQRADRALETVAFEAHERLAPAIERIWVRAIEALRADLRGWVRALAADDSGFVPERTEYAFGLDVEDPAERDAETSAAPARVFDGVLLRGSIDLVERDGAGRLRVTDHKTGRRLEGELVAVRGGRVLQPMLYALALEQLRGDPVIEGRLSYCTQRGGFHVARVPVNDQTRAYAKEVIDAIDDAVARAFLPAAPEAGACELCDYRLVCGPGEEARTRRKDRAALAALTTLREVP